MSENESPFVWDGQELATLGKLLDGAMKAEREGRAAEFLKAYREYTPHADANLGYLIGYVEPAERRRELYAAFTVDHPIFGGAT